MFQTPGVLVYLPIWVVQPITIVCPEVRPAKFVEEQKRMDTFQKLDTPCFDGDIIAYAHNLLDMCHEML